VGSRDSSARARDSPPFQSRTSENPRLPPTPGIAPNPRAPTADIPSGYPAQRGDDVREQNQTTMAGWRPALAGGATAAWIAVIALGLHQLNQYSTTQTAEAKPAVIRWTSETPLGDHPGEFTLLFFVHPKCACTAASIDELRDVLSHLDPDDRPDVRIIVRLPDTMDHDWLDSPLRRDLHTIPRARIRRDPGGSVARAFGATTSGEIILYGEHARRRFQGGVTAARAHRGPSPARNALADVLTGARRDASTPAFGCALFRDVAESPGRAHDTRDRTSEI